MSTKSTLRNLATRDTADKFLNKLYVAMTISDYLSSGVPYDSDIHKAALNVSMIELGESAERLFIEMGEEGIHPVKGVVFSVNDPGN